MCLLPVKLRVENNPEDQQNVVLICYSSQVIHTSTDNELLTIEHWLSYPGVA